MSWLRIDDGFTDHPKILSLTLAQRWTWLSILTYCARFDTEGRLPAGIGQVVRGASPSLLSRCHDLGLLDVDDGNEYVVHDWVIYNGATVAEKVAYYMERHPEATANQVQRAIGGKRELVLHEVAAWIQRFQNGSPGGSVTGSREPPNPVPKVVPEVVLARTLPSPTPKEQEQEPSLASPRKRDAVWDFVVTIEGEPLPRHRAGRGRIVSDLRTLLADEPPAELERRHEALAREWGDTKATARALVQHWHRAGEIANGHARPPRPPSGKFSADDLYLQAQQHHRDRNGGPELGTG